MRTRMALRAPLSVFGILLATVGAGCQQPAPTSSTEDKKAFTGPAMPADAQEKMRQEQAKAMGKMRTGAPASPR